MLRIATSEARRATALVAALAAPSSFCALRAAHRSLPSASPDEAVGPLGLAHAVKAQDEAASQRGVRGRTAAVAKRVAPREPRGPGDKQPDNTLDRKLQ